MDTWIVQGSWMIRPDAQSLQRWTPIHLPSCSDEVISYLFYFHPLRYASA